MQAVLQLRVMLLLAAMMVCAATVGRSDAPTLRVATFVLPPYVMMEDQQLAGFSIDLWNAVAARLNVRTEYQMKPDVDGVLAATRSASRWRSRVWSSVETRA